MKVFIAIAAGYVSRMNQGEKPLPLPGNRIRLAAPVKV